MATLISSLSDVRTANAGERRFAERLKSHLEDDYVCWHDVRVGTQGRYPDFVIFHPRRGLLVVEVKDWKRETIARVDKYRFDLHVNGKLKRVNNPLEQARECVIAICDTLQRDPALIAPAGTSYEGRLVFPWGYGVALTGITRKQFSETDLGEVLQPDRVICQDEMTEGVDAGDFQKRLWAMFGNAFPCHVTVPQIERVRWHIFPEVRIVQSSLALEPSAEAEVPDIVRVMDLHQEQLARNIGEGHRVIHGVAGSGKTMILGFRAQHLAQVLVKPILVLCFNKALAQRLDYVLKRKGVTAKVHARHFHRWCNQQLRVYHIPSPPQGENFSERLVEAVIRGVDRGQIPRAQYGAVLIDEGHDFEPEWLKLVVQMIDPETNSLLVLYDDAQSINKSKSRLGFSFAEVGIQARGRTTVLKLNYRNTAEVMHLACAFAREVLSPKEADEDGIPLLVPQTAGRRGDKPQLRLCGGEADEAAYIVDRAREMQERGMEWRDMAVLYRLNDQGRRLAERLTKAGLPVSEFSDGSRFDPEADTIKLLTYHGSKGLEFPVVFMPALECMPLMKDDLPGEAKLLYVGMTRAVEKLFLSHRGKSPFVYEIAQALAASG